MIVMLDPQQQTAYVIMSAHELFIEFHINNKGFSDYLPLEIIICVYVDNNMTLNRFKYPQFIIY